ncbi:BNR repeat-containing protein [Streptomyces beihaiensis]|uniref:BNR repeat-containing protein n=1 Tax=Streptomyces beihaiensis TaxID=2984495 RepID=A0ABT3TW04_9ACTN|nr:BNR repeat-containing protein [Streptomyces beihaiensis]MCX3061238.1 BNR repeat-containing protein [Streptomyces beihaiensis]
MPTRRTALTATVAEAPGPSLRPLSDTCLDDQALYFVSYDGLVNNNSFQKNGLLTYRGHQYAAWYTADRTAVLARRALPGGPWRTLRLSHRLRHDDSHNVISMGVSPLDGRLHVVMDAHSDAYVYVKSGAGLMARPGDFAWSVDHFGPARDTLDGVALTDRFTYPQFLATPEGRLQLLYRTGVSGNGRAALAEYDGAVWRDVGEWSSSTGTYTSEHGSSTARSMYVNGFDYGPDQTLHVFFTWREHDASVMGVPGGLSNHDMAYVSSDDRGRTWRDVPGTLVAATGTSDLVSLADTGTVVEAVGPDHALMNQESQAVDSAGRPHALWSYVPGRLARRTAAGYAADRLANARTFHMRRDSAGMWHTTEIPQPPASTQRSRLAFDRHDNAYAIMPRAKIVAASSATGWTDWQELYDGADLDAFGEVVIDESRLTADGVLSVLYQQASTGTTPSPIRVADFRLSD